MKKAISLFLLMAVLLGLSACNAGKSEESSSETYETEVYLETYFHGTNKTEQGETLGVLALLNWYSSRLEFEFTEYSESVGNVVYHQADVVERPEDNGEDETFTIERTKDDSGQINITLSGNDLTYIITRGDTEEVFVLQIITEDDARKLK